MTGDLVAELRRRGVSDVDDSVLARALYSSDASLYRVEPRVVVRPRHTDELPAILDVARSTGAPITMRGAGTSIAGNAVGPGIVVDTARHLDRILSVDPETRTAVVQPGVVHANLQRAAAPHGLRFGPDPSTHTRCTVGGMVGNNACGSRALGYGRTADNVAALKVAFGNGETATLGDRVAASSTDVGQALHRLADGQLAHVRQSFGRFSRQVSGYSLEHLLPENGRRLDRFLVGSEGTLGIVLEATVELVPDEPRRLTVLGYPSMAEAADAVPTLLADGCQPRRVRGPRRTDRRPRARRRQCGARPAPWRGVAVRGDRRERVGARAPASWSAVPSTTRRKPPPCGGSARTAPGSRPAAWTGRRTPAGRTPPSHRTGSAPGCASSTACWRSTASTGVPYGHFGDGCVHVRIDFEFDADGRRRFREFLVAGAHALRAYGGSLSGEHGDGRARSELLPLMYDDESLRLFAAVKAACDPDDLLNPGVLVDPAPLDADLRPARPVATVESALRLTHDGGSLAAAAHRCTGVGKCVAPATTGVMCPSHLATRDEKDSTRGRARVLQEALDGSLVHGLGDPAVTEALDLCLACKGCASDCPTGVDMATYKAEALHQQYAGRRRPRSHYTLGRLPRWADLAAPMAGVANRLSRGPLGRLAKAAAGVDQRRSLPAFAPVSLLKGLDQLDRSTPDVWIWADSFTDHFLPQNAEAAIRVLADAGLSAAVIPESACCALT